MTSSPDPDLDVLVVLSAELSATLGAINDHQLVLPTPCSDWDLSDLVDHVTGGNWFTCQVLDGQTADAALGETMARFQGGNATSKTSASSVDEQLAAFTQPGVLDRTWHHVVGDLTGREILRLRLHDLIIHLWDIRQTLAPPASIAADLVKWALAELSSPQSLGSTHFELAPSPTAGAIEDPAVSYLSRFGRQLRAC